MRSVGTIDRYLYRGGYTIRTEDGNQFVFDVRTGEVVSSTRPLRWALIGLAGVMVVGIAILWRRRVRRGKASVAAQPTSPLDGPA